MGNLLFSPSGRIGPAAYMKGITILAILGFLGGFTVKLGPLAILGFVLGLLIFYCFIALGIKRSHDAGKSGWMVLIHILIWFVILMVVGFVVGKVSGVDAGQAFTAAMNQDVDKLAEIEATTTAISYILMTGIAGAAAKFVTAFLVNTINKSDAHDNQFGPMTAGDS